MKSKCLLFIISIIIVSCQKNETIDTCQLVQFIQENPLNKTFHYDNITLKDGRIERFFSFDLNANKDTLNKVVAFFEYNAKGKVKAIRDEANPIRIKRFDGNFDDKGNVVRIVQTTNGNIEDEIEIENDARNRPTSIVSKYLLGINRNIEYDNKGNPYSVFRADLGTNPTITEYTFDDKRNFFSGIPEIQFYWIARPHSAFLPYGDNNIASSKVYSFNGREFIETESLRSKREFVYNDKGFPEIIRIIREDLSSTVSNISSLSYKCR